MTRSAKGGWLTARHCPHKAPVISIVHHGQTSFKERPDSYQTPTSVAADFNDVKLARGGLKAIVRAKRALGLSITIHIIAADPIHATIDSSHHRASHPTECLSKIAPTRKTAPVMGLCMRYKE